MYDTKGNKYHLCTRGNFFNCQQSYHHIHFKVKKHVLQCTNSKMLFVKKKTSKIIVLNTNQLLCYFPVEVSSTSNQSFE